jgi:hypothetical protein
MWCFNIVGGEILTFPDTLTTQGVSLVLVARKGGEPDPSFEATVLHRGF